MQSNNIVYNPFIRAKDSTSKVMFDVVLALLPCLAMSYLAFGFVPLALVAVAVGSTIVAEFIFSALFFQRFNTLNDGSAIVTGILLAFTLGAFTPLYVVSFGAAMGVIFGKLLWGGLGRNMFNPALIGREFMTIFFPAVMTSGAIWYDKTAVNLQGLNLFDNDFIDSLIFKSSGAVGEYSIVFLSLGGLYLLLRRRISWHIPFSLFALFTAGLFIVMYLFPEKQLSFSLGGLMLGALFMATDMPSSASTRWGKCFYGAMIGLSAILFIFNGVRYEYMSYSILLLNGFSGAINWVFRPRVWGRKLNFLTRLWQSIVLVAAVIICTFAVIALHEVGGVQYLLYALIAYCIVRFIAIDMRKTEVRN